jgi:hypothetical protein
MSSWKSRRGKERELGKRSRGVSAKCHNTAEVSVAVESDIGPIVTKSPPALPGLVWDEAKQRYFRLPPTHSHLFASAAVAKSTTPSVADAKALNAICEHQTPSSRISLIASMRSACAHPYAYQSLPMLPIMRECIGSVGRAPIPAGSFHWSLAKRQLVQDCKQAAYFSRSVVLFSDKSVSFMHVPAGVPCDRNCEDAPSPINEVLQLPSNSLLPSATNVTTAFHSSDRYSWLNPGTCIHVAVAAQHGQQTASAAAIAILNCQCGSSGMVPLSVQSSFLLGARHPCSWLGRGGSFPTLDWEHPTCYVAGGRGGQHVAALALDQAMVSRTAPEWRMPNCMAVSCMSLWAGCGTTHGTLIFCGGSSCDAVSIDPRSSRTVAHHDVRHVTQCGWSGGYQMVCGHVGGNVCVWDMRFTKNAISTTAPHKEVFSLWSLSVSANSALALFTKHDSLTFLDLNSLSVKKFETQIAVGREGCMEVVSRIGSQGEGCAVFDNTFVAWDSNQAWAWKSRFG